MGTPISCFFKRDLLSCALWPSMTKAFITDLWWILMAERLRWSRNRMPHKMQLVSLHRGTATVEISGYVHCDRISIHSFIIQLFIQKSSKCLFRANLESEAEITASQHHKWIWVAAELLLGKQEGGPDHSSSTLWPVPLSRQPVSSPVANHH